MRSQLNRCFVPVFRPAVFPVNHRQNIEQLHQRSCSGSGSVTRPHNPSGTSSGSPPTLVTTIGTSNDGDLGPPLWVACLYGCTTRSATEKIATSSSAMNRSNQWIVLPVLLPVLCKGCHQYRTPPRSDVKLSLSSCMACNNRSDLCNHVNPKNSRYFYPEKYSDSAASSVFHACCRNYRRADADWKP